jgi:hypothetical protein
MKLYHGSYMKITEIDLSKGGMARLCSYEPR